MTTSEQMETIGQRLRRLRVDRGLSQRELSGPGVSYAYISRIEAGARRPSVKALRTLAPKLGVSVEYLETGSDLRDVDEREFRLFDAELQLRLEDDPVAAERTLFGILDEATKAGDIAGATRARIALGMAAARRGEYAEAIARFEEALESGLVSPVARPDVYSALGRAYAARGSMRRAADLFERCLDEVRESGEANTAAHVRFATDLSYALTDLGFFERANTVLDEALEQAEALEDPYTRVRLYWSIGRLETLRGQAGTGLESLRRAIALLEATEDVLHLAKTHLLCAWSFNGSGRAQEARPHLERAERLFGPQADRLDRAYLRTEQAKCSAQLGEADDAVAYARDALDVLGDADPHEQGGALFALALGLSLKGDAAGAEDAFRRSADLLEEHGQPRECAEALRAWAKFLRKASRESEALDVLERAAALQFESVPAAP
jgi:tetratricopeptide (TPR) repeat protein